MKTMPVCQWAEQTDLPALNLFGGCVTLASFPLQTVDHTE